MDKQQILAKVADLARLPEIQAGAAALLVVSMLPKFNRWLTRRKVNNYLTDKSWDWKSEIVVVTGGSSGIGALMVAKLVQRNVKVILVDLNEPQGKLCKSVYSGSLVTTNELNRPFFILAPRTFFYRADLSDPSAIASIAERIRTEHGNPTVLINNAGIGNAVPLLDLSESQIRKVFDVNIIALILLVQEFLPSMVQRNHGHIVNIASLASFSTQASNVEYACSKAAVLSFHEGLTQELRHVYKAPMVRTR